MKTHSDGPLPVDQPNSKHMLLDRAKSLTHPIACLVPSVRFVELVWVALEV